MSNDFLHSSPSRDVIDPLIYQSLAEAELRASSSTAAAASNSKPNKGKNSKKNSKKSNQQPQPQPQSSVPPSATKMLNPNSVISSGWTPLISKTYFNDQILSFNSTPNKYLLSNLNNSSTNNNFNTNQLNQDYLDFTQGLNLTPFLNHNNLNILQQTSSTSVNQQLNNITPFNEKTLHLTDFFMDSPIRQTPIKDLDTITPSRFKLNYSDKKPSISHSNKIDPKSAQKRSITQIDTPPRQPHKLSISTKAADDSNKENEQSHDNEDDNNDDDDDYDEDHDELLQKTRFFLQTPSKKVLSNITNFTKTPIKVTNNARSEVDIEVLNKFQTPAKQIPSSPSSPSTVIMSSAVKQDTTSKINMLVSNDSKKNEQEVNDEGNETTDEEDNDNDNDHNDQPPSPTPNKESKQIAREAAIPIMGVFSEKKTKPVPSNKASLTASYAKSSRPQSNDSTDNKGGVGGGAPKGGNRTKMQAGMNKFQIIFTDVHTLMNNRKKKGGNSKDQSTVVSNSSSSSSNKQLHNSSGPNLQRKQQPQSESQQQIQDSQNLIPSFTSNHNHHQSVSDHNMSINTSKEISIMSAVGNTSHLNLTSGTDHSMDLGGISTTPNGKFFLDKVFDKNSPQTQNLLNSTYYMIHQQQQQQQHLQPQIQLQQHNTSMPPPTNGKQQSLQQSQMVHPTQYNLQQQQQQPHPIMMMMSTPQHQNVINYANTPQLYGNDNMSPDDDTTGNFMTFPKEPSSSQPSSSSSAPSSQGYMLGLNQSMMMPTMMNMKSGPNDDVK